MPRNYEFSPGYHAQQLKLIKQSPGDGFYRTSRPMFDTAEGTNPVGSLFFEKVINIFKRLLMKFHR